MTNKLHIGWMNIGVAVIVMAGAVYAFASGTVGTTQLVLQTVMLVLSVGMLAQGIHRVVAARRS